MSETDPDFWTEDEWHEWRRAGITASDVARAATGRYGGAYGVVCDKLGYDADPIDEQLADRGHRWESFLLNMAAKTKGLTLGIGEQPVEHLTTPEHRATPDGFMFNKGDEAETAIANAEVGAEGKTTNRWADTPWDYYYKQCHWGMHVTGLQRWLLVVGEIDDDTDELTGITCRWVHRDQFEIDALVAVADRLAQLVHDRELPEPDASSLPAVRHMSVQRFDPTEETTKILTAEESRLFRDLDDARSAVNEQEDRLKEAKRHAAELEGLCIEAMGRGRRATTCDDGGRPLELMLTKPAAVFTDTSLEAWSLAYSGPDDVDHVEAVTVETTEVVDGVRHVTRRIEPKKIKQLYPKEYAEFREHIGARRLQIKTPKTESALLEGMAV